MMILWKEWRQQRPLFLLGCLAGIIFPVFEVLFELEPGYERGTNFGGFIVFVFGAFFAILLAVATTYSDLQKGIDDFWQSKPLKSLRLFIVKFLLASVVLLASFLFVMSPDMITAFFTSYKFASDSWAVFFFTYPIALMMFAVAMFFTVLLRDSAKAVLMAIWVALLVYFLPLLVRQLNWLNVFEQFGDILRVSVLRFLPFAIFTIVVSITCVILSVIAFKRKWLWNPGQKTIAWTLGLSAAFIYGLSVLQAGCNLEYAKMHKNKEIVSKISFWEKPLNRYDWTGEVLGDDRIYRQRRNPAEVCFKNDLMFRISTGTQISKELFDPNIYKDIDPDMSRLYWKTWKKPLKQHFFLDIYHLPYSKEGFHLSETRFFATSPIGRNELQKILGCFIRDNRLYAAYSPQSPANSEDKGKMVIAPVRLLIVDVNDPNQPRRISDKVISQPKTLPGGVMVDYGQYCYIHDGEQLLILSIAHKDEPQIVNQVDKNSFDNRLEYMLPVPGRISVIRNKLVCNDLERIMILDLTEPANPRPIYYDSISNWWTPGRDNKIGAVTYSEGIMYIATNTGLFIFELKPGENGMLCAKMIGRRRATPIERFTRRRPNELMLKGNLLIESAESFGVLAYDVSNPVRPKRIYHAETLNHTTDIGTWDGLVYMVNFGKDVVFLDIPKAE